MPFLGMKAVALIWIRSKGETLQCMTCRTFWPFSVAAWLFLSSRLLILVLYLSAHGDTGCKRNKSSIVLSETSCKSEVISEQETQPWCCNIVPMEIPWNHGFCCFDQLINSRPWTFWAMMPFCTVSYLTNCNSP